jgi:hypothetical protein
MTAPACVGRYEIVRRLGKSMTDVYLAIDTVENRKVALKLIRTGGDPVSRLVLEAERRGAEIQRQLRALDPRMVEIYNFGDEGEWFFVAMQYVEGRNLSEVLHAEGRIDPVRAATIALEICEQLAKFHAWHSPVVHGDIKPSNIHLGCHDTVRLLDFGIAKKLREDRDDTNHNFGSPSYCSPERLTRSAVDPHSDLWAVGATLYELLAGAPPYQADNTRKLESLIRSRRAPRALPPGCPPALQAIVSKALAPDPRQRYGSARQFQADLQAFLEHRPTAAEQGRRAGWAANSTIEAARACFHRATQTLARARKRIGVSPAGAVGWFALGMTMWVGGTIAWEAWHARKVAAAAPKPAPTATVALAPAISPTPRLPEDELPKLYAAAGRQILEAYRHSSDPSLHDFDWHKAELYLERAAELGGSDDTVQGQLALCRGYAALERLSGEPYSRTAAMQLRLYARGQFTIAAQKMPQSPDPHLALARVYVYSLPDVSKAMAEFDAAERLGAALGQREFAQQADAWRLQAARRRARRSYPWL